MRREAVIPSCARPPIGRPAFKGSLNTLKSPPLAAVTLSAAVSRAGIDPDKAEDQVKGRVLTAGTAALHPARLAARAAGLPGAAPLTPLDPTLFPGLPMDIVIPEDGGGLPAERRLIRTPVAGRTASLWDMAASPGRAWATDEGGSRASVPISRAQSRKALGAAARPLKPR